MPSVFSRRRIQLLLLLSLLSLLLLTALTPRSPLHLSRLSLSNGHQPTFHLLLPIDAPNPLFCQSLLTAFLSGLSPVLVNYNTSEALAVKGNRYENMALKIKGVMDYLENNVTSGKDVVLMADAMDVWWQLPKEEIMERYLKMDSPLVFSAEKNCMPSGPMCETFPLSPLPEDAYGPLTDKDPDPKYNRPRWLNSGLIIGRASHFLPVFTFAQKLQKEHGVWNDQAAMHSAYSTGDFGITLDFGSELFQSIYAAEGDIEWKDVRQSDLIQPEVKTNSWTLASILPSFRPSRRPTLIASLPPAIQLLLPSNRITHSFPASLHFNGGNAGKEHSQPFWEKEWWVLLGSARGEEGEEARRRVREVVWAGEARVAHDGRRVGWGEMCAGLVGGMWGGMGWLSEGAI